MIEKKLKDFSKWVHANNLSSKISIKLDDLESIHTLDLTKLKLRELPKSISLLKNLMVLKVSGNRLTKLP